MTPENPMPGIDVKLLTRSGEYVITACIPNFKPPAEIVYWGDRAFIRQPENMDGQELYVAEYREGIVAIPLSTKDGKL